MTPTRALTDAQVDELCNDLAGTTQSMDVALPGVSGCEALTPDDLTPADLNEIDQNIFECQTCNWWCNRDEESEDKEEVCDSCADAGEVE